MKFDLEPAAVTRFSLIVKKRRDKLVIKRRLALIFKTPQDGLRVKCKCNVSRGEVEAYAEDELKVDLPPIEGKCKSSCFWLAVQGILFIKILSTGKTDTVETFYKLGLYHFLKNNQAKILSLRSVISYYKRLSLVN